MSALHDRIPEPEFMTEDEERCYAEADYSVPHQALAQTIVEAAGLAPKRVIDIGCGPGDVLFRIRRLAPEWTLYGVDLSARMLQIGLDAQKTRLRANERPVNWVLTDGRRLGFATGEFDVILSNSVLHHVAEAGLFWAEVKRISAVGTHVFVRDLRRPPDIETAKELVQRHVGGEDEIVRNHYYSSLLSSYTCEEVRRQLGEAGLDELEVREVEDRYLSIEGQVRSRD